MKTNESTRLLERDDLLPQARELLTALEPSPGMPPQLKAELAGRVSEIAAQPPATGGLGLAGPGAIVLLTAGLVASFALLRPPEAPPLPQPVAVTAPAAFEAVRLIPPREPEAPVTSPRPADRAVPPQPRAAPAEGLAAELRLLAAAKSALPTDPRAALAQLDLHAARFGAGQLVDMREYLRLKVIRQLEPTKLQPAIQGFLDRFEDSAFRKDAIELGAATE